MSTPNMHKEWVSKAQYPEVSGVAAFDNKALASSIGAIAGITPMSMGAQALTEMSSTLNASHNLTT